MEGHAEYNAFARLPTYGSGGRIRYLSTRICRAVELPHRKCEPEVALPPRREALVDGAAHGAFRGSAECLLIDAASVVQLAAGVTIGFQV